MRIKGNFAVAALVAALVALPMVYAAQNPNTMMPAHSTAKAHELIDRAIAELGGQKYLTVKDITRKLRLAQFGGTGDLEGFSITWDYWILPDKNRTEYFKKRNIISVYDRDKGWVMDRAGVEDATADSLEQYQDSLKRDIDNLFRYRLKEDGLIFRFGGSDLLDLKQVDWIEIVDRERRQFRVAFERKTGLPIRAIYNTRDPETRVRVEEVEYYSNYHEVQGIQTPMQVARERNGRKVYQVFIEDCQYNTGLNGSFFTRQSLEEAYAKVNKKKKS